MRKGGWILAVWLLIIFTQTTMAAGKESYADACAFGESSTTHLLGTAICLGFGAAISVFGLHEGGHYVAAAITGHNPRYRLTYIEADAELGSGDDRFIRLAGLGTQAIATEIILDIPDLPREHPVIAGVLIMNILHPVWYTFRNETGRGRPASDLNKLERKEQLISEVLFLSHAFISAYRLIFKDDRFPLLITSTGKDIALLFEHKF